ncbi:type VII secretion substrate EsaC, partial [Staphylococcus aureus]
TSANKDSVTVKGKAPNTLYIEKRNLMKQKLEMLGEDIDKNKESLQKAKEIAGEKASEYFNKAMN